MPAIVGDPPGAANSLPLVTLTATPYTQPQVDNDFSIDIADITHTIRTHDVVTIRFVAVGQGPLADEIRSRRDALGLGDRFVMLGYRDDAPRLMAAADLFVLASSHEGLPVAVMEAFALGVPVVATAVGGVAEAVTDGESGLLVAPGDPTALAEAILRATDPVLRAHLAAGADAAAERFSSAVSVRAIEETYVAAVDRRRR